MELADELGEPWPKEDIPDADFLYMRVHYKSIDEDGEPIEGTFHDLEMSTNWDKYSTPELTQREGRLEPSNYAVVKMNVAVVRKMPGQIVDHTPIQNQIIDGTLIPGNRSHTDVIGEKTKSSRVRLLFKRASRVVIPLNR